MQKHNLHSFVNGLPRVLDRLATGAYSSREGEEVTAGNGRPGSTQRDTPAGRVWFSTFRPTMMVVKSALGGRRA